MGGKSTMKRFFFGIILIALFACPFRGQAGGPVPGLLEDDAAPLSSQEFHLNSQGIYIQVKERPLG
jgi:hypothetical protein